MTRTATATATAPSPALRGPSPLETIQSSVTKSSRYVYPNQIAVRSRTGVAPPVHPVSQLDWQQSLGHIRLLVLTLVSSDPGPAHPRSSKSSSLFSLVSGLRPPPSPAFGSSSHALYTVV